MGEPVGTRLRHAWSVFRGRDQPETTRYQDLGVATSYRPDRTRMSRNTERSVIAAVYNKISIEVATNPIHHVRIDEQGRYVETIKSNLDNALSLSPNLDQTARALIQDIVLSMFDDGCVAVVPVTTSLNPDVTGSYDIDELRVGQIIQWYPSHVRVKVYNEQTGRQQEVTLSKKNVAIIENPLYAVMNEPNSTLKRLVRKLNILDAVDEQSGSGKLDIIIQLPYVIRSEAKRNQAEERRKAIEDQLAGSKYGVAYTDGTEKITQLNRSAENNLMKQIEYLTALLYNQLGLTQPIFEGTADEQTMLNYYNTTIEPILAAIVDEMRRKFLTKTARTQGQTIMWFNEPFKLVPVSSLAAIADKFTRNEILSSNEVRSIIGYRPVEDPRADELRNKNLNASSDQLPPSVDSSDVEDIEDHLEGENQNG